jgi:hypothetical protein
MTGDEPADQIEKMLDGRIAGYSGFRSRVSRSLIL